MIHVERHARVQSAVKLPGDVAIEVGASRLALAPVDDERDTLFRYRLYLVGATCCVTFSDSPYVRRRHSCHNDKPCKIKLSGTAKAGVMTVGYDEVGRLGWSRANCWSGPGELSTPSVTAVTRSATPRKFHATATARPRAAPEAR